MRPACTSTLQGKRTAKLNKQLFTITMFFDGLSYHHRAPEPEASPYNDGDHGLAVVLTFAIFSSFVVLYLTTGIVWAMAITALAVALSFWYLRARRRRHARAVGSVRPSSQSNSSGLDRPDPAVSRLLPAFAYKREGGGGDEVAAGSGWSQCVVCLGIVQVGEAVRRLPACSHIFHVDCIDAWLHSHSTCPICRAVVAELTVGLPSEAEEPV